MFDRLYNFPFIYAECFAIETGRVQYHFIMHSLMRATVGRNTFCGCCLSQTISICIVFILTQTYKSKITRSGIFLLLLFAVFIYFNFDFYVALVVSSADIKKVFVTALHPKIFACPTPENKIAERPIPDPIRFS